MAVWRRRGRLHGFFFGHMRRYKRNTTRLYRKSRTLRNFAALVLQPPLLYTPPTSPQPLVYMTAAEPLVYPTPSVVYPPPPDVYPPQSLLYPAQQGAGTDIEIRVYEDVVELPQAPIAAPVYAGLGRPGASPVVVYTPTALPDHTSFCLNHQTLFDATYSKLSDVPTTTHPHFPEYKVFRTGGPTIVSLLDVGFVYTICIGAGDRAVVCVPRAVEVAIAPANAAIQTNTTLTYLPKATGITICHRGNDGTSSLLCARS